LGWYADAARAMRARQVAYRARRLVPLSLMAAGTAERPPAQWRPLAAGLGADPAPPSGPQEPPEHSGSFTFVGHARAFSDTPAFWSAGAEGLLFAFQLHGFGAMARYAAGSRTEEGDAFWAGVTTSWLGQAGRPGPLGWHPYPLSNRIIAWCAVLSDGGWPDELEQRMLHSLTRQTAMLRRCIEHDIGGNHVLRNLTALIYAGACLGDPRLVRRSLRGLRRELTAQILVDGGHEERSTAYHRAVRSDLDDVVTLLCRAQGSAPAWLEAVRARMIAWEQALRGPDGKLPLLNDAWEGPAIRATGPRAPLTQLRESGYLVLRHATDQLIVDAGPVAPPHLPPHAHADVLSFVLWADGKPLVVDPGSYTYTGPQRAAFRGTAAHNTVEVDGVDQCEFWGDFRAAFLPRVMHLRVEPQADAVMVSACHDGYRRLSDPVEHERWFWWIAGDGVVIVDRLRARGSHQATARIHLAPGVRAASVNEVGPFAVHWLGPATNPRLVRGEYAPYLGTREAIDVLEWGGRTPPDTLVGCALLRPGATATLEDRCLTVSRRDGERVSTTLP
jgi:uncharacterized heparinase superfamily protein